MEEDLKENEELFRNIFDNAVEGILIADIRTQKFLHANHAICTMLGYSAEELVSMGVKDIHPDTEYAHVLEEFMALARGEETLAENIPVLRKDGTVRYMDIRTSPVIIDKHFCNLGTFIDATDRRKAEEALRASELRYMRLFENMPDGIAYCRMLSDENGHPVDFIILTVNSAFNRIIGTLGIVGKPVTEVFPDVRDKVPELFEIYGRTAGTGEPESFDLYFKPIEKWLHIIVYSPDHEYFVAIVDDLTEFKKMDGCRDVP